MKFFCARRYHELGWVMQLHFNCICDPNTAMLAKLAVLGNFVGMLTDSRSFLSYARHEYFRRILCRLLGRWVEEGMYPADMEALGGLVQDICSRNAIRYFNLEGKIK